MGPRFVRDQLFLRHFATVKIEKFLHLLIVIFEGPFFGVMIGVEHSNHHALHVSGFWAGNVGSIEEVEGDALDVPRRAGDHPRLIAGAAIVSEYEAVGAVEVDHRNHVLGAVAVDFAHQGRAPRGLAEGNLYGHALRVLPFPRTSEGFELVERFLGGGLRQRSSCGCEKEEWNGDA